MKDLNKKLTKYLKEKSGSATKTKSEKGSLTPHVTYGITSPSTALSTNRKTNSRQFSMTLSFFNPKFVKQGYPQDFVVRHEDAKQKMLIPINSARLASPKRDPILQDNKEETIQFKPCVKRLELSDRMAMFTEEQVYSAKMKGDYNPIVHARSLSPRPEGIRTGLAPHRDPAQDVVRRQLKTVHSPLRERPNPITEGDIKGVKLITVRKAPEISDETKRLNDLKFNLASERGSSRRGRIFWDTKIQLNTDRPEYDEEERYNSPRPQNRLARSDEMKETIEYESALPYRDQGVTGKVNGGPMSNLMKAH